MANRLYVGNLSWDTTEDSLRLAFEQDGRSVTSVNIITDRDSGRPRGFAFVEMGNQQDAQAAITALDGSELDGRNIRVNEAQERPQRGPGGGRPGGGGGRGGGRGRSGGSERW
jgi:RNA recognition motif-containing protein